MGKTIADIRRKYRSINLLNLIDTVIRENEHVLIGLVRSQLSVGESAVGQLPQYKSLYYAKKKTTIWFTSSIWNNGLNTNWFFY